MFKVKFLSFEVEMFRIAIRATNTTSCWTTGGVLISMMRSSSVAPNRDHLTPRRMTNNVGCLALFGFRSSPGVVDGEGGEREGTCLWTFQATLTMDSNVPVNCCATNSAAFMLLRRCRTDRVDRVDRVEEEEADEEEDKAVEATAALAEMGSMRIKKCCLSQGCSVMGRRDVFVFNTA